MAAAKASSRVSGLTAKGRGNSGSGGSEVKRKAFFEEWLTRNRIS
jgi:hypothetical protein